MAAKTFFITPQKMLILRRFYFSTKRCVIDYRQLHNEKKKKKKRWRKIYTRFNRGREK